MRLDPRIAPTRHGKLGCGLLVSTLVIASAIRVTKAADWPAFRGDGTSTTTEPGLPVTWSPTNHVAWRIELAGVGQSSPVVRDGRIYVTSAAGARKETLVTQALAVDTGRELWRRAVPSSAPAEVSDMASQSAPTPVVAQDGLYALFESGDCVALDLEGRVRWHRVLTTEVGPIASNHGLGGSPVVSGDLVLVPLDQDRPSSLLALDRATGDVRWRAERPRRTAWSTPIVAPSAAGPQVIVSGGGVVSGYEVTTGRRLWEIEGLVRNLVPSPTLHEDLLVVGAGSKGSNVAYRWSGGAEPPVELWRAADATTGFASPLIHRGRVYFLSTAGVLNCLDAATGRRLFDERVAEPAWASPIGAGDRVYVFGERGRTTVLAADDAFRPLATNELAFATRVVGVAVADRGFVVRAYGELARLADE